MSQYTCPPATTLLAFTLLVLLANVSTPAEIAQWTKRLLKKLFFPALTVLARKFYTKHTEPVA